MLHCMVVHLPDTASYQAVITVDFLPVALDVSWPHAHGMGILAQEVRTVHELLCLAGAFSYIVKLLHRRIHARSYVICLAFCVDGTLIMHRNIGDTLEILISGISVASSAALISKAPHDNRSCQRLVPLIMADGAAQVMALPSGIV